MLIAKRISSQPRSSGEGDAGPAPCTKDFPDGSSSYETLRDLLDSASRFVEILHARASASRMAARLDPMCPSCAGDLLNALHRDLAGAQRSRVGLTNVSMPETNIFGDISSGSLPAVFVG